MRTRRRGSTTRVRRPRLPVAAVAPPMCWLCAGAPAMRYLFGDCVLDTQCYTLHRAGQPVRLRPKVFQMLVYLLSHRERVVAKQELSEQVWKGQAISDATLESTLAAVRRALGDQGRVHRYICTLHGYGYRFVAPVEERAELSPNAASVDSLPIGGVPRAAPPDPVKSVADHVLVSRNTAARYLELPSDPIDRARSMGHRDPGAGSVLPLPPGEGGGEGEEVILPSPMIPGAGERKLVSVLCCGISPAARASADLDRLHQQVRVLYDLIQGEARRYGGSIQPVVGERVLAVFGLPAAQEDHAQRAVLAALGLQRRLEQGPTSGDGTPTPWLSVCMAVHTGSVAIGGLNSSEAAGLAVVGETLTQAAALQVAATPGVIFCSEVTARLVRELVRLEAATPEAGLSPPVSAYQILGLRPRRAPIRPHGGRTLSPFVGRQPELTTLQTVLAQVEAGRGQVVGIVGEPGLGKSRLLYEFRRLLRPRRLTYLAAGCRSYAQTTPYGPMRELLQHTCGITEADPPASIIAKVHRGLAEVGMAADEVTPYLL
jgi:DNA-binding winged helix-turn-helix (wHTH) protein/class 3 adenylate cyclase